MENRLSPPPSVKPQELSFPDAMKEVIAGKRIQRIAWENKDEYGILVDGWLSIRINGKFNVWKVSDGDMLANDWIAL